MAVTRRQEQWGHRGPGAQTAFSPESRQGLAARRRGTCHSESAPTWAHCDWLNLVT